MTDDLDLGLDDFPMAPDAPEVTGPQDKFDFDVAYNLAFVGVGQGGSRIAEAFHKLGYARVAAINTTAQDLRHIDLPDAQKLDLGGSGAGKDPAVAAAAVEGREEDIFDLLKTAWGNEVDYAFVCFGAGGGTGAGAYSVVAEVAKRLLSETKRESRLGIFVALPRDSEGQRPAANAVNVMQQVTGAKFSPAIVIDNQRIEQMHPNQPLGAFHGIANSSVARVFHIFNRLAAQASEHTTFDRADLGKLLDSGCLAFGAQKITEYANDADISRAVRKQLTGNILASVDLTKGKQAGLILSVGRALYDAVPAARLEHAFESLSRVLDGGSTIFQGIYPAAGDSLHAFTMVGQLPWPVTRITELARKANISADSVQSWLDA
jgi:cell division protein FtsZ